MWFQFHYSKRCYFKDKKFRAIFLGILKRPFLCADILSFKKRSATVADEMNLNKPKENEDDGIVTPSSDDTSPMVSEQGHSTLRIQNSVISICMRDLELETEL